MSFAPIHPMPEQVKEFTPVNDKITQQTRIAYAVSGLVLVGVTIWSLLMV